MISLAKENLLIITEDLILSEQTVFTDYPTTDLRSFGCAPILFVEVSHSKMINWRAVKDTSSHPNTKSAGTLVHLDLLFELCKFMLNWIEKERINNTNSGFQGQFYKLATETQIKEREREKDDECNLQEISALAFVEH